MTDAQAKKGIARFAPVYDDDHITTDPHQWRSEVTLSWDTLAGLVPFRTFTGRGATKGEARKDARQQAGNYTSMLP